MSQAETLIEFALSHINELRDAIVEKKAGASGGHTGGTGSGHAFVSDPTANAAVRMVSPVDTVEVHFGPAICGEREHLVVRYPEKWLKVAVQTKAHFAQEPDKGIALFYESKYNACDHWSRTCQKLRISRGSYYSYRKDVLYFAALFAVHEGILEPSEHGLVVVK